MIIVLTLCSEYEGQLRITFRPETAVLVFEDSAIWFTGGDGSAQLGIWGLRCCELNLFGGQLEI